MKGYEPSTAPAAFECLVAAPKNPDPAAMALRDGRAGPQAALQATGSNRADGRLQSRAAERLLPGVRRQPWTLVSPAVTGPTVSKRVKKSPPEPAML